MGFRFWRRVRILPGVTLNLSKKGASVSVGPRGAKVTAGSKGVTGSVGIPGTGLFYTKKLWSRKKKKKEPAKPEAAKGTPPTEKAPASPAPPAAAPPPDKIPAAPTAVPGAEVEKTRAHVEALAVAPADQPLVEGVRAFLAGDEAAALAELRAAMPHPDAAFLAGVLALKHDQAEVAAAALAQAAPAADLGATLAKYGLDVTVEIPITEEIAAAVSADKRGALLALAEANQRLEKGDEAAAALRELLALAADDVAVKLALAELLMDRQGDQAACEEVVKTAGDVANESPLHAALLLYKARALGGLALWSAAKEAAAAALKKRAGRPADLLHALRYELALALEWLGEKKKARAEWEKLYAEDPDFEDVKARLGMK